MNKDPRYTEWYDQAVQSEMSIPLVQTVGQTPYDELTSEQVSWLHAISPIRLSSIIEVASQVEPPNVTVIAAIGGMASERAQQAESSVEQLSVLKGRKLRKAASSLLNLRRTAELNGDLAKTARKALNAQYSAAL